jgi:hypothetical protein
MDMSPATLQCPRCGSLLTRAPGTETTFCGYCGANLVISSAGNGHLEAGLADAEVNTAILAKKTAIQFIRETNLPPLFERQQELERQIVSVRLERRRLIQQHIVVEPVRQPSPLDGIGYMGWALAMVAVVIALGSRALGIAGPLSQKLLLVGAGLAAASLALPIVRRLVWTIQKRHVMAREAANHAAAVAAAQAEERRLNDELTGVKGQITAEDTRITELETELNRLIRS